MDVCRCASCSAVHRIAPAHVVDVFVYVVVLNLTAQ